MSDLPDDDFMERREGGPKITASDELEEALREATEALEVREVREAGSRAAHTAGSDASSPDKMTIEMLSQELRDLKTLYEEQLELHVRLQAEFENFRRRNLKEKQESLKFGHQNLVKDLLSAVDNLERAVEHGAQNAGVEVKGILDGVELVQREILAVFAKHGVSEIPAEGLIFDPAFHEAMGQIPNGKVPANTVLQVLQKGYVIHDRMLRPTRVIVSREPEIGEASIDVDGGRD